MISQLDIQDTLNSYAADEEGSYDDLLKRFNEVRIHLTNAAAALDAGMMQTPGPINRSPYADLSQCRAHLQFALSAWED